MDDDDQPIDHPLIDERSGSGGIVAVVCLLLIIAVLLFVFRTELGITR